MLKKTEKFLCKKIYRGKSELPIITDIEVQQGKYLEIKYEEEKGRNEQKSCNA